MAKYHLVMPLSLTLMDESIPGQPGEKDHAIGQFAAAFTRQDETDRNSIEMRICKERIPGTDRFTYRTYFNRRPPTLRSAAVEFNLYPVVKKYRKHLILSDSKTATALREIKVDKRYDINLKSANDIPDVAKVIMEASADNLRHFASGTKKTWFGELQASDIDLSDDQFFAASLFVTNVPKGRLDIPSLAKETLGFDMLTAVVARAKPGRDEMDRLEGFAEAGRTFTRENELEYKAILKWREGVAAGHVESHYVSVVYTFYARTLDALDEKIDEFRRKLPVGVETEWLPWVQKNLYLHGMPVQAHEKSALVPSTTLSVLYPPMADLLETSGVFLGTNWLTQSAVYLDLKQRDNGNVVVVGKPGGGKSMLMKTWTGRDEAKNPDSSAMVIVDPSVTEEYRALIDYINSMRTKDKIEWRSLKDGLGIDVLRYGPSAATNVLSKLFNIHNDNALTSLLFSVIERAINSDKKLADLETVAKEMMQSSKERRDLYETLMLSIHKGLKSYGHIFAGEAPKGSFAFNIFSLDDVEVGAAMSMAMLRAREFFFSLPADHPKKMIIDEGYLALAEQEARVALDKISRQMRKSGLQLFFATQRPGDLQALAAKDSAVYETAVAIVEDSDTQLLFAHPAISALKEMLALSQYEINMLRPAKSDIEAGRCVLIVGSGKAKRRISHTILQVNVTSDELARYNTDPTKTAQHALLTNKTA